MADITVINLPKDGVSLDDVFAGSFVAMSAGPDKFLNSGNEVVFFKNDDVGAKTITITSQPDDFGRTQDEVVNVAAGEMSMAGPFRPRGWSETSGVDIGKVGMTPSDETSLSVLVLKISDG